MNIDVLEVKVYLLGNIPEGEVVRLHRKQGVYIKVSKTITSFLIGQATTYMSGASDKMCCLVDLQTGAVSLHDSSVQVETPDAVLRIGRGEKIED